MSTAGFVLDLDEVDLLVLGEFVDNLAEVLGPSSRRRQYGPHDVGVDCLKRHGNLEVRLLLVRLIDALPDGADTTRRYFPAEAYAVSVCLQSSGVLALIRLGMAHVTVALLCV